MGILMRWSKALVEAQDDGVPENRLAEAAKNKLGSIPELPKGLCFAPNGQIEMEK
jgi:hypothetical protein